MDTDQLDEEQLYYKEKYFKYKLKYVALKKQLGAGKNTLAVPAKVPAKAPAKAPAFSAPAKNNQAPRNQPAPVAAFGAADEGKNIFGEVGNFFTNTGQALNDLGGIINIGAQSLPQVQTRPLTAVEKLAIIDQEKALKQQQQKEKDNNDRIRSNAKQAERKAQEKLDDMEKRENIKKQNLITAKNKLIIQYLVDCFNNNKYNTGTRKIIRLANEEKSKMLLDRFINFNAFQKLSDITLPLYDNKTNVDLLIDKIISSDLLNQYADVEKKKTNLKEHLSNSVKVYIQQNQEIIDKAK
jgi:hypothetical protein